VGADRGEHQPSLAGIDIVRERRKPELGAARRERNPRSRADWLWPPLMAVAAALTVGSGLLLVLHANGPLWMLLVVSVIFGLRFGLTVVTNQAAMNAQAPANATGAATDLLRTPMYLGRSASLISLCYGPQATDCGLHRPALLLTIAALGLLVATIADRTLASQLHHRPVPR
jgi:hypothetical protein